MAATTNGRGTSENNILRAHTHFYCSLQVPLHSVFFLSLSPSTADSHSGASLSTGNFPNESGAFPSETLLLSDSCRASNPHLWSHTASYKEPSAWPECQALKDRAQAYSWSLPHCSLLQASEYSSCSPSAIQATLGIQWAWCMCTLPDRWSVQFPDVWGSRRVGPTLHFLGQFEFKDDFGFPMTSSLPPHPKPGSKGCWLSTVFWLLNLYCLLGTLRASCLTVML